MPSQPQIAGHESERRGAPAMRLVGELNGAVADLGVLLPYALGLILAGLAAPTQVFAGFGLAYLASALIYRAPIPVQPMKAIGALALADALTSGQMMLSGVVIGLTLIALGASGLARRMARIAPQTVTAGLQLGLGGMLGLFALTLMRPEPWLGAGAVALLLALGRFTRLPAALVLLFGAALASLAFGGGPPVAAPAASGVGWPAWRDLGQAIVGGALPQLPMTLTNAVLVTAALARDLFPGRPERATEQRLCLSSGFINLLLCPLGALPMCHGAGGLAAHHRFGARTGLGIGLLGAALLALAALPAETALSLLSLAPPPVLGALLLVSAFQLAATPRLFDAKPSCRPVIAVTALATMLANPALGIAVGLAAEAARGAILRRLLSRRDARPTG